MVQTPPHPAPRRREAFRHFSKFSRTRVTLPFRTPRPLCPAAAPAPRLSAAPSPTALSAPGPPTGPTPPTPPPDGTLRLRCRTPHTLLFREGPPDTVPTTHFGVSNACPGGWLSPFSFQQERWQKCMSLAVWTGRRTSDPPLPGGGSGFRVGSALPHPSSAEGTVARKGHLGRFSRETCVRQTCLGCIHLGPKN